MTIIQKVLKNIDSVGTTIKNMPEDKRNDYILGLIAPFHPQTLTPYIEITKHDEQWRRIEFTINNGNDPIYHGETIRPRRTINNTVNVTAEQRERYVKEFIAVCYPQYVKPFIKITHHNENFTEIHYTVEARVMATNK